MRFDLLFALQNAAQTGLAPVILIKKWRRFRSRRDAFEWDPARWRAPRLQASNRLDSSADSDARPHLILVAMGFAEARLAAQLTALLQRERPELRITWAIRNRVAARQGQALPADQAVVPLPFDYFWPVRVWIDALDPDAVVFIERFQFPVLARALHNHGARVGVVAARTRDHRGGRYRLGAFYGRWLRGAFDLMGFRSPAELEKLGASRTEIEAKNLAGQKRFQVTGSLKFWPQIPALDTDRARALSGWLTLAGQAPLLAAGSTQPGDEAWVLEAFAPLREKYGAVLLLAPRHVTRADEVEKLVRARGWKVARRSDFRDGEAADESETQRFDVLLLDTLGELTVAYGAARAAFVGGTLTGTGHNVLEPIAHGIPVFFGPKTGTFALEQAMCEAASVGFRVEAPGGLTRGFERALGDEKWLEDVAGRARKLNAQGAQAWSATVAAILELLEDKS